MALALTAEDFVRRIAAGCAYVASVAGAGIRLEPAAAIAWHYGAIPAGAKAKGVGHFGGSDHNIARNRRWGWSTLWNARAPATGRLLYYISHVSPSNGASAPDSRPFPPHPGTGRFDP